MFRKAGCLALVTRPVSFLPEIRKGGNLRRLTFELTGTLRRVGFGLGF